MKFKERDVVLVKSNYNSYPAIIRSVSDDKETAIVISLVDWKTTSEVKTKDLIHMKTH